MTAGRVGRRTRVAAASVAFAILLLATGGSGAARQPGKPQRHALLIGVTRYPNLAERHQLNGPANDVALMRKTLVERLGVARDHITELAGWPSDAAQRPTRANIEREFARLAKTAAPGDQVMVLFAGHGSQQPDNDPPGTDEEDGLDEIILPADVGGWDGGTGHVLNAISDDTINVWVTAIRNQGAFIWLVFDACQSSTLTRGTVTEQQRLVPAEELVPKSVLDRVRSGTHGAAPGDAAMLGLRGNAGGIAALYAAQTIEPTPEKKLPDQNGPVHGLFTYTLAEILQQATTPVTYRDLAERVIDRYRALGRIGPTPGFEGGGLDNPVLGAESARSGPRLVIGERTEKGLALRAGTIAGLTRGTILAVYPPAGAAVGRPIGHVQIADLDPTSATIVPVAHGGMNPPDAAALVPGSRAEVAQFDYGDQALRIASAPGAPAAIEAAVAAISQQTSGLARQAPSITAADWIVQLGGDNVVLAPASGWQADPSRGAVGEKAPFLVAKAASQALAAELARVVTAISRARNLMHLAATMPAADATVDVEVELLRYRDKQDTSGTVVPLQQGGRVLHVGDQVAFRLRNTGASTADVTLLFIDAHYGIEPLFPPRDREADSRLKPQATVVTSRFDVRADTTGWEQVVALAVEASTIRVDFRGLAQPTLDATREVRRGRTASGLQRLLDQAMYGSGGTRSLAASDVGRHAVRMLAWKTVLPATTSGS